MGLLFSALVIRNRKNWTRLDSTLSPCAETISSLVKLLSTYFDLSWSLSCKNLVLIILRLLLKVRPFCTHEEVSKFGANEVLSFIFFVR
jgi:hypothetical protein